MKIAPFDPTAFHQDHPAGTVSFNYLLMGDEPQSPENYRYILGRQDADFHMPRHRHTFEQIRLPLTGDMNLGEQGILHQGEIGYFPEGLHYEDLLFTTEAYCSAHRLALIPNEVYRWNVAEGSASSPSRERST